MQWLCRKKIRKWPCFELQNFNRKKLTLKFCFKQAFSTEIAFYVWLQQFFFFFLSWNQLSLYCFLFLLFKSETRKFHVPWAPGTTTKKKAKGCGQVCPSRKRNTWSLIPNNSKLSSRLSHKFISFYNKDADKVEMK